MRPSVCFERWWTRLDGVRLLLSDITSATFRLQLLFFQITLQKHNAGNQSCIDHFWGFKASLWFPPALRQMCTCTTATLAVIHAPQLVNCTWIHMRTTWWSAGNSKKKSSSCLMHLAEQNRKLKVQLFNLNFLWESFQETLLAQGEESARPWSCLSREVTRNQQNRNNKFSLSHSLSWNM